MKSNAILINCARDEVIEIDAVAQALSEEKIAGVAIDVLRLNRLCHRIMFYSQQKTLY